MARTRKTIYVFTEDKKTTSLYLKSILRNSNFRRINNKLASPIQPDDYSPNGLFKAAKRKQKELKKDGVLNKSEIWVAFDKDQHSNIKGVIDNSIKNNIKVAFSNLCFELWIYLHFEQSALSKNKCDDFNTEMKKFDSTYKKNKYDFSKIHHKIGNAINFAKNNFEPIAILKEKESPENLSAYTNFYELMESIFSGNFFDTKHSNIV